jgi:hypothetical protein
MRASRTKRAAGIATPGSKVSNSHADATTERTSPAASTNSTAMRRRRNW